MASGFLTPFTGGRGLMGRGDPFLALHREMNRLFDDTFRDLGGTPEGRAAMIAAPRMDVQETENEIRISAELPGITQNDIDLRLEGDILTIRGEKHNEREQKQQDYHVMERVYGTFQRSIQLPFSPDPDQVQASFENGVLTVTLPKQDQQEKSRRIEVRTNKNQPTGAPDQDEGQGGDRGLTH